VRRNGSLHNCSPHKGSLHKGSQHKGSLHKCFLHKCSPHKGSPHKCSPHAPCGAPSTKRTHRPPQSSNPRVMTSIWRAARVALQLAYPSAPHKLWYSANPLPPSYDKALYTTYPAQKLSRCDSQKLLHYPAQRLCLEDVRRLCSEVDPALWSCHLPHPTAPVHATAPACGPVPGNGRQQEAAAQGAGLNVAGQRLLIENGHKKQSLATRCSHAHHSCLAWSSAPLE
jgi:hypothetical protein